MIFGLGAFDRGFAVVLEEFYLDRESSLSACISHSM